MKNKQKLYFVVFVGAMSAIATLMAVFIHFPIIPAASFLEYDPADIVIFLTTYIFGIPAGLCITAVVSILQGLTVSAQSGIVGILMHIISSGTYVLVFGLLNKKLPGKIKTTPRLCISTSCAILANVTVMTLWNLIITPIYLGARLSDVLAILVFIILFNIIKSGLNGVIASLLSEPVGKIVRKYC